MIEITILEHLKYALNTDRVFLEMPKDTSGSFVVFTVKDRTKTNQLEAVTIEVCSYAESKYASALLDQNVREAMEDADSLEDIMAAVFSNGNDSPDTSLKKYRYRSYFNITF